MLDIEGGEWKTVAASKNPDVSPFTAVRKKTKILTGVGRVSNFFYCVGRIGDFFYRVSGFFFLQTCACFLEWGVLHMRNSDAVKERKKEFFCKVQTTFISTYLSWVENFSKSEFLFHTRPHVFTVRVSKVKWSHAEKCQGQLLKQLICYASNTQPSLLGWPLFLMIKGDHFKKDSFLVKNIWRRKTIFSWPECTGEKWEGEPWQNGIFKADGAGHW